MKNYLKIFGLFIVAVTLFWMITVAAVFFTSHAVNRVSSYESSYMPAQYPAVAGYMRFTAAKSEDSDDMKTHFGLMRCPLVLEAALLDANVQSILRSKDKKYPAAFLAHHLDLHSSGEIVTVSVNGLKNDQDMAVVINAVMKAYCQYHRVNPIGAGEVSILYEAYAAEEQKE